MNKKGIIALVIILVLAVGGIGGYLYYKDYMKKHQPNVEIGNTQVTVPSVTSAPQITIANELAKGKDPQYTEVAGMAESLYPTLSGVYEPIWDEYEPVSINILAKGENNLAASYKVIWAKQYLYVQVMITDTTPITSGPKYNKKDSVEFFINEDGQKNSTLAVGDAHYIVARDNTRYTGFGADSDFQSVTYEMNPEVDEDGNVVATGYYVEAVIPLLTIKATKNSSIGFDIQVNNATREYDPEKDVDPTPEQITNPDGSVVTATPTPIDFYNVDDGVSIYRWASNYIYTFQNFSAVGTLTFK